MKIFLKIFLSLLIFNASKAIAQDGALDPDFGNGGKVVTSQINNVYEGSGEALATQSDGKIVVVSGTNVGANGHIVLLRYNYNGSFDLSFGNAGIVHIYQGVNCWANALIIQPDGKIIVGGVSSDSFTKRYFTLIRFKENGMIDLSFGINGIVVTSIEHDAFVSSIILQPDGKIVAAGEADDIAGNRLFALARYNSNGLLDNAFGNDGIITTNVQIVRPLQINWAFCSSVALQQDGKIIAGGTASDTTIYSNSIVAIVRYDINGEVDSSFGVNGRVLTGIPSYYYDSIFINYYIHSLAIQTDGKIIAAGHKNRYVDDDGCSTCVEYGNDYFAVFRYNTDGTLDNNFGINGKVFTEFNGADAANSVFIQPDGKIVAAGNTLTQNEYSDFALSRYNPNGALDNTFGSGGKVTTDYSGGDDIMYGSALQSDGKIVAAGFNAANAAAVYNIALARYIPQPKTITTDSVSGTFCVGSTTDISFSISGTFFPGNIFTAQLSDVNGSFANAINIGTTEGVTGGNIPVMFPKNLPFGGNYKIRVISNGPSVVGTSSGYITLLSLPEPVIIQNGDTVSVGSFSSYQWFLNNVLITGATQSEYIVTEVGNYTVTVELNGCYNTSDSYFVEAKTFEWQVNLFPNPTSGKFKLQIYNLKNKPLSIKMFDVLGELIYKEELRVDVKNYLQQFDINNLSDGIYYLQIQSDKLHLVKPVILTKL